VAVSSPVKKARRSLIWFAVIIVGLVILLAGGVIWGGASWTPKLALDLEGGTQIILAPKLESGQTVSVDQLNQAVSIIRERINASGVSEAEITTQGGQNIVVSLPGQPDQETLDRIQASARLDFRPVLEAGAPANTFVGENGQTTQHPSPNPLLNSTPTVAPTNASDLSHITPALRAQYNAFDCASLDKANNTANVAPADQPLITCEADGSVKYILGPVEVSGADIVDATSGVVTTQTGASTGQWAVNIVFDSQGTEKFSEITSRLNGLTGSQMQFAIVLDGQVISAPQTNAVITDGRPQITGNFTQGTAQTLADQLKYGALPISFTVQSTEVISATLGSTQLISGLIAGLIGLILVIIYSLLQYRLLGIVTIASLIVAFSITYVLIALLSWSEGYRLSLAGVAGLIVAIGITADSFIVYFERIRDELRDSRGLVSSVEVGWKRAIRTILASDAVNFLAAAVLFVLAIGNVRGFALTLGLTTIVDVIVVVLFTHPMLQLLAQTTFFGEGHKLSGLDPRALGAIYRGRAQFRQPTADVTAAKQASSRREAVKRQTIAERKAAENAVNPPQTQSHEGKDS
jgi:preprotein translocase subunit SecD